MANYAVHERASTLNSCSFGWCDLKWSVLRLDSLLCYSMLQRGSLSAQAEACRRSAHTTHNPQSVFATTASPTNRALVQHSLNGQCDCVLRLSHIFYVKQKQRKMPYWVTSFFTSSYCVLLFNYELDWTVCFKEVLWLILMKMGCTVGVVA